MVGTKDDYYSVLEKKNILIYQKKERKKIL